MNSLGTIFVLKLSIARNAFKSVRRRSAFLFFALLFFFGAAAFGFFWFFLQSFRFFAGQEPFGLVLIDETFYLLNFSVFLMLFVSTGVSAYSGLFRSPEIPFLATRPPGWDEIFFLKLAETTAWSSWAVLFIVLPYTAAFGIVKSTPVYFPLLCLGFYLPLIVLAGTLGTLVSMTFTGLMPKPSQRRAAWGLLAAGVIFLFLRTQPQLIKEQGSLAGILSGYLPHIAMAKHHLLPSSWVSSGILAFSRHASGEGGSPGEGIFYFLLLLSNALFILIPAYAAGRRFYPKIFLRLADHEGTSAAVHRRGRFTRAAEGLMDRIPWLAGPLGALFEKDIKIFRRDPAEWSQLIIFFGLLLLYFANLRNLQFHVLEDFWRRTVFALNSVGTYIVLSMASIRIVFPSLSLEGAKFWLIRLSPVNMAVIVLEKFFLGMLLSLSLTLPLIFLSGWMLRIPGGQILLMGSLGGLVSIALTGLSAGFGALFPNFKTVHTAEIISGFGGSLLLFSHLAYLGFIGFLLIAGTDFRGPAIVAAVLLSLLAGFVPPALGAKRLNQMEF